MAHCRSRTNNRDAVRATLAPALRNAVLPSPPEARELEFELLLGFGCRGFAFPPEARELECDG